MDKDAHTYPNPGSAFICRLAVLQEVVGAFEEPVPEFLYPRIEGGQRTQRDARIRRGALKDSPPLTGDIVVDGSQHSQKGIHAMSPTANFRKD